jgi:hypothetical protein
MYPLRMAFPAAVPFAEALPILHWVLAGWGLPLCRTLGISRAGGWQAEVTYAFTCVVVSDVFFPPVLPGMALLPWVVWALARPGTFAGKTIALSALLALGILAGDVFTLGMGIRASLGRVVFATRRGPARSFPARAAAARRAGGSAADSGRGPGFGNQSGRHGVTWRGRCSSRSRRCAAGGSRSYPFGAVWTNDRLAIWGGSLAAEVVGSPDALLAGRWAHRAGDHLAQRSPAARFGRFLVAASFLLGASWFLVPAAWADSAAPLALRNPEKFALLLPFGLAVLSGLAIDALRTRSALPRWILGAGVGLALLAIGAAAAPGAAGRIGLVFTRSSPDLQPIASREIPYGLAEAASLWLATAVGLELARLRAPAALAGLAVLTLVPIAATRRIGWTFREDEVFAPPAFVRFQQRQDPSGEYRSLGEMAYRPPGAL